MESINLEDDTNPCYAVVFKIINLVVAALSVICGFSELFSRFDYFFQGLFVTGLGVLIGYLEFRIPPKLFTYASSFFSFLGRGCIYMLIAVLNLHGSLVRYIIAFVLLATGILYACLEFVSSVQPPNNMQGETGFSDDMLDDII